MSKKSPNIDNPSGELAAQLAEEYFNLTDPIRQNLVSRGEQFLGIQQPSTVAPQSVAPQTSNIMSLGDWVKDEYSGLNDRQVYGSYFSRGYDEYLDQFYPAGANRPLDFSQWAKDIVPKAQKHILDYQPGHSSFENLRARYGPQYDEYLSQFHGFSQPAPAPPPAPAPAATLDTTPTPWDVSTSPQWQPARRVAEEQFANARDSLIASMPAGGQLESALADLQRGRGDTLTDLAGAIAQDEYNKIYGLATGVPQQTFSTLATVGGQQANAAAQEYAAQMGKMGDLGMGAGMALGAK